MGFYDSSKYNAQMNEQECTAELANILETSPKVTRLLQSIFALNKTALRNGITCRPCQGTVQESKMGYYSAQYKRVVVCCNNIRSKQQLEETVVHELVHAFDATRKGKFSTECHLVACGEVRASALGQCHGIRSPSQKRKCIIKDATRSTAVHCGNIAMTLVQEVFDNCVKDTAPFIQPTV